MIAAGLFIIFKGYLPMGAYLLLLGINYVPLLIFAVATRAHREVAKQNPPDLVRGVRKYGVQQILILVPLAVPVLAILQRPGNPSRLRPAETPWQVS
jgi:hypothetical protein